MYQRFVAVLLLSFLASTVVAATSKPAAPAPAKAVAAEPIMKPGLWEVSSMSETRGATAKRTTTSRICYSAEDVLVIDRVLPPQRDFSMKCTTRDVKYRAGEAEWRIACTGKGVSANGAGKATFGGESYSATAKLDSKEAGKISKIEQTTIGKWVGSCQ